MRIAIAGINHETNTYCRDQTQLSDFRFLRGSGILAQAGTETAIGGALSACAELDIEPVPITVAMTQPSGTIAADAYASMKAEILDGLQQSAPVDGVYLDLHGAGVVDGLPDLEADLAASIRTLVGPTTPICASFDLHGNITQAMADALDGVFACHQYPHIDLHLRAIEAVQLIAELAHGDGTTALHVETIPALLPTTTTFLGPGESMLNEILAAEATVADVVDISWFHGFPYTDVAHVGVHVCVTVRASGAGGGRELAANVAKRIAARLWDARETFRALSLNGEEAVAEAQASSGRPVVINETSDNCGGGAPGDGTHLLRAMLDAKLENACFGFIVDPEVAGQAHRAGVGATIDVSLGGKYDDLHGAPLHLSVYVKALHDGRLTMTAMGKGARIHYGPLARLQVDGFDIIVGSRRSQTFDTEPFIAVGIDVTRYDFVALKSSNHFRAGFTDLAGAMVTADTPGLMTHHIEVFPREHAQRALWPIDDAAHYDPQTS